MNRRGGADEALKAWELLLRTHATLVATLEREVEEATGLPLSWYDVLLELNSAPERKLRMTELGERVVLSRSRVSRIVDELLAAGLVTKKPDAVDGRATFAVLTNKGYSIFRRAAPSYLKGIQRHFSSNLTASESATLVRALSRVLRAHFDLSSISQA